MADPYEEIPSGVMAPRDARLERGVRNRVEREADRLMGGRGQPQPPPQAQPRAPAPYAGRFAEPSIAPETGGGGAVTVTGPNGITIEFPDGTDHDTINKVMSQAAGVQSKPPLSWSDVPGEALRNAPKSAGEFVGNIAHAVMNPLETAGNIADVAAGGLRAGAKAILPERVFRAIDSVDAPQTTGRLETKAGAVGNMLADRYGSSEGLKQTLANDPVGALADASTVLTGGGSLAARAPGYAGRIGQAAVNAGNVIDPVRQAGRMVARSGDVAANVLGVTTGAGTRPIREAFDAGRTNNQAFVDNMRGNVPVGDVVDMAENAVNQMSRERSAAYNADMANVNTSRAIVDYAPIRQAVQQGIDEAHFRGIPIDETAANVAREIGDVVERFATSRNTPGQPMVPLRTPAELDAAKRAIGEIRQRTQQGTLARRIADNAYRTARDEITRQVPEYAAAMRNYSEASDLLQEMRRTMSINDRAMPDTTIRKLQSTMRNNVNTNYGAREALLDELARIEPNLPAALAGQSLNAIAPRNLARVSTPIEAGMALMYNPSALAALPLASPRAMGEVAHAAGFAVGAPGRYANRYLPASVMAPINTIASTITPTNALMMTRAGNVASLPDRAEKHKSSRKNRLMSR